MDAVIAWPIAEQPDFDQPDELRKQIESGIAAFANDMIVMLG